MRKQLSVLLVLVLGLILARGMAGAGESTGREETGSDGAMYPVYTDGEWEYILEKDEACLKAYVGEEKDVVIPSELDGKPVVRIPDDLCARRHGIVSLVIPEGVREIGDRAFYWIQALSTVTFPASLTSIGEDAFGYTSLKEVVIPGGDNLVIGKGAFIGIDSLETVFLGEGVTEIGRQAFDDYEGDPPSLYSVRLPNTLRKLGLCAFFSMSVGSPLLELDIPDSVIFIGRYPVPDVTTMVVNAGSDALQALKESGMRNYRVRCGGDLPAITEGDTVSERADAIAGTLVGDGASGYDRVRILHDYLVQNAEPDPSGSVSGPEGVLLQGKGTSESYARAFALLLDRAGIPNELVHGSGHAWNMVCLDGAWTHVDCAWDDAAGRGGYTYFCVTDEALEGVESHELAGRAHEASDYTLNYSYRTGGLDSRIRELLGAIGEHLSPDRLEYTFTPESFAPYAPGSGQYWIDEKISVQAVNSQVAGERFSIGGKDYTVSMRCDLSAGTVVISAERITVDIAGARILYDKSAPCVYTGEALRPVFSVVLGDRELVEGEDYTLELSDNVNAGQASLLLRGTDGYSGEKASTFVIQRRPIWEYDISLSETVYVESGRPKRPKVIWPEGTDLVMGRDYSVSYMDNIALGEGTVEVRGRGNYGGYNYRAFTILRSGQYACHLPASTERVEAGAFEGAAYREFILPDRPVTLEAGCFRGQDAEALQVTIPNAASEVSAEAFAGMRHVTIIAPKALMVTCEEGRQGVEAFCRSRGYTWEKPN